MSELMRLVGVIDVFGMATSVVIPVFRRLDSKGYLSNQQYTQVISDQDTILGFLPIDDRPTQNHAFNRDGDAIEVRDGELAIWILKLNGTFHFGTRKQVADQIKDKDIRQKLAENPFLSLEIFRLIRDRKGVRDSLSETLIWMQSQHPASIKPWAEAQLLYDFRISLVSEMRLGNLPTMTDEEISTIHGSFEKSHFRAHLPGQFLENLNKKARERVSISALNSSSFEAFDVRTVSLLGGGSDRFQTSQSRRTVLVVSNHGYARRASVAAGLVSEMLFFSSFEESLAAVEKLNDTDRMLHVVIVVSGVYARDLVTHQYIDSIRAMSPSAVVSCLIVRPTGSSAFERWMIGELPKTAFAKLQRLFLLDSHNWTSDNLPIRLARSQKLTSTVKKILIMLHRLGLEGGQMAFLFAEKVDLIRLGWSDSYADDALKNITIVGVSEPSQPDGSLGHLRSAALRCNCIEGGITDAKQILVVDVAGEMNRLFASSRIRENCEILGRADSDYKFEFERISAKSRRIGSFCVVLADKSLESMQDDSRDSFSTLIRAILLDRGWTAMPKIEGDPVGNWFMRFGSSGRTICVAAIRSQRIVVQNAIADIAEFLAPVQDNSSLFHTLPTKSLLVVSDRKKSFVLEPLISVPGAKVIHFSDLPSASSYH